MFEATIDLDWADDRYPFVRSVKDLPIPHAIPSLELTLTEGIKITGSVANLREFAAQIIAACDAHYPLESAAVS